MDGENGKRGGWARNDCLEWRVSDLSLNTAQSDVIR